MWDSQTDGTIGTSDASEVMLLTWLRLMIRMNLTILVKLLLLVVPMVLSILMVRMMLMLLSLLIEGTREAESRWSHDWYV